MEESTLFFKFHKHLSLLENRKDRLSKKMRDDRPDTVADENIRLIISGKEIAVQEAIFDFKLLIIDLFDGKDITPKA